MKKILNILVVILTILFISSCDNLGISSDKLVNKLTILSINDFHGAISETNGQYGAARLAHLIDKEEQNAQASVLLSAGDMFQGTAVSNYNRGKTVVDIMNEMKFDSMTLGNHEFDWGYDEVYKYVDGNKENGEANFPYLGCNIYEKKTGELAKGVQTHQIIERGGLKIGVIGYMGQNLESSISESMIEDYEFVNPLPIIEEIATGLRVNQNVNIIIVVGHEGDDSNRKLANLTGDARIDAIINSHTHYYYSGKIMRYDGVEIPYLQAGSAGEKYGVITLNINQETKLSTGGTSTVKNNHSMQLDGKVKSIVSKIEEETASIFQRVLGVATEKVDKYGAADWAATALREYTNTDIAFINLGGIRSQAFPINEGSEILVSTIHEMMPFDNIVKTVELKGSAIVPLVRYLVASSNVTTDSAGNIYINGELLVYSKIYKVASVDYVFDKPSYPFLSGDNIVDTGVLFRDILIAKVEEEQTIKIPMRG